MWHVWWRGAYGIWWGTLKERDHFEDISINASIILKCILKNWRGVTYWIHMAQDNDKWRAFLKTLMQLWVA
jgi:hypothetical protein